MERAHVFDQLMQYLASKINLSVEDIPLNESLLTRGLLDSFGVVELLEFMETTFDIKIPDRDVTQQKLGSVNKMVDYIVSRRTSR